MEWRAVFWFVIAVGNIVGAIQSFRERHDFWCGVQIVGGLYSCLLMFKFMYM